MKTLSCCSRVLRISILPLLLINAVGGFGQVDIYHHSLSDEDRRVLQIHGIDTLGELHYALFNQTGIPISIMVEAFLTEQPDRDLNRVVIFKTSAADVYFGMSLSKSFTDPEPTQLYQIQLYAYDYEQFGSDSTDIGQLLKPIEKQRNYISDRAIHAFDKRIVLGDLTINYIRWRLTQRADGTDVVEPMYKPEGEIFIKISVIPYSN